MSIKKLNLNKKIRIAMILLCSICIITMAGLIYYEYKVPDYQEEKIALYNYYTKADINPQVSYLPNLLYDAKHPAVGGVYITNFIDVINTSFQYQFTGEQAITISGNYRINAEVEGYTGEKDTYKTIWKKNFTLIPETSFQDYNNKLTIQEEIPLNLVDYNNFANEIAEVSKVNSQVKLIVFMDVSLTANTEHGIIEEKVSPSMVIPLNANYFEIAKNIPDEKDAAIEEARQVLIPVNKNLVIIYSVGLCLMLIALLCIIYLTVGTEKDMFTKTLNKIFKKHGSRLVALDSNIPGSFNDYNKVKAIDDLVRIADEISKPIMYKYSSDPKKINQFYVLDESQAYIFDLKEAVKKMEMEKPQKPLKKLKIKGEKDKRGVAGQEKVMNTSK